MNEFITTYGIFLAKSLTIVIAILVVFGSVVAITTKNKFKKEKIEIIKLNQKYEEIKNILNNETLSKEQLKQLRKKEKENTKFKKKHNKDKTKSRIFVLEFIGDIKASAVDGLREEITAILTIATPKDEVLIKIESAGGTIHGYGLAASQLKRIRDRNIPLTASVDKVAASGGYMMACVANRIIAAPFAILGSIGVIAQLPNFNRLLKKHNIDFEQIMAGQYKRTISMFGENTKEGREKLQQEVEEAHKLFKDFITINRPVIDINTIATGETWYGTKAKNFRLIDDIITSDDYLLAANEKNYIFQIEYKTKKGLVEKFSSLINKNMEKILAY